MGQDVVGQPRHFTFDAEPNVVAPRRDEGKPMSGNDSRLIAVALDESQTEEEASRAMSLAIDLAEHASASILAVRIGGPRWNAHSNVTWITSLIGDAERTLPSCVMVRRVVAGPSIADHNLDNDYEEATSAAGEAFVATATGCGAQLLVVSASNDEQPLEGLVSAVVTAAMVPTVVVPCGVSHIGGSPFHLVVALDGIPHAGNVAKHISDLHGWFHTSVSLLHVLHPGGGRLMGVQALAHDRAAHMLQRSAACLSALGIDAGHIHVVVRSGPTSNVIVDHLRREHATFGVLPVVAPELGHRRPHGVTNAVLSKSHVPVVLFQASSMYPNSADASTPALTL